jgi:uncharacterized protein
MPRGLDWLLPERRDVLGMLRQQAALTIEGMEALRAWAATSDQTAADRLRGIEHQADDVKRALRLALRDAFITPIGQEDIYVLSDRLDAVLSAAKNAVRESEVMGMGPDKPVELMCALLADGVRELATAFQHLGERSTVEATDAADAATRACRGVEKVYRTAMSDLLDVEDMREVMGRREIYRRLARISETLDEVAERVWYASVKEA